MEITSTVLTHGPLSAWLSTVAFRQDDDGGAVSFETPNLPTAAAAEYGNA
ncbi:hypothetical protein [Arthrobacter globiformis]|nr:hypothetical protein [Arthrobacter globiformis]MDQ0866473.1 hypothetical protein [Arthrobacter globiformis]